MAYQEKMWQNFYERAWAYRAEFMRKCLRGGANSCQAIGELAKMERTHVLSMNDNKDVSWEKLNIEGGNSLSFANVPILQYSSTNGKEIIIPYHTNYNFSDFLIDVFDGSGGYDCIVELGCGYGRNLFHIFYNGGARDVPYFGGEFTQSGVGIAQDLAKATPGMDATFFHFNHLEPNVDIIKEHGFKRAFVFTCHTIEQVKAISDDWFGVVASMAKHVRCVHLEPYGFQAKHIGDVSLKHQNFMIQNGWNLNFFDTLKNAVANKQIVLDDTILEIGCSTDPYNPGSIACWHSDIK
ncbi:hypothetical protein CMCT_0091 [Campylobacter mucosalis]|uniref:hypothetical protein n=1 Tax=Campylobacter mucosalis TaxID=202 RepID=UPI001592FEA6|nr:hypothetical protein [Campylobacter mucosalis]QKF62265.1 hypothetical protein CMCT_0091 [Campylobacter mucosalis]